MFCGWETCHCHCDIILDVKLRSQPHWIVPFSWIQELSPCPAGRALGGSLPAGDCPVFQSIMGMEAAQAMSALGPTAACLVLGLFPPAGAGHGSPFSPQY